MRAFVPFVLAVAVASLSGCPAQTCSADVPCATGEMCQDGVCQPDEADGGAQGNACGGPSGSVPNLVTNSGFECGTTGWAGDLLGGNELSTTTESPKSGAKALVITVKKVASRTNALSNTVTVTGPTTVCARAWMRGSVVNGHLVINHAPAEGGQGTDDSFSLPVAAENKWVLNRPSQPLAASIYGTEKVTIKLQTRDEAVGTQLIVDDVQLWESKSGSCSERQ